MDEEFETWLAWFQETEEFANNDHYKDLRAAWLESARRADKRAREECGRIATDIAVNQKGSTAADVVWALAREKAGR